MLDCLNQGDTEARKDTERSSVILRVLPCLRGSKTLQVYIYVSVSKLVIMCQNFENVKKIK